MAVDQAKSNSAESTGLSDTFWYAFFFPAAIALIVLCGVISYISPQFADSTPQAGRPVLQVFLVFTCLFFVYLVALVSALRIQHRKLVFWSVIGVAILCRGLLLVSYPFQEIDAYRYIWDGNVVASGLNPYQYSPAEARQAAITSPSGKLQKIARIRAADPGLNAVLNRVHYAELPTAYPPVSQAVFALSAKTTPVLALVRGERTPSLESHLFAMKGWIVVFDLGCLALVFLMLGHLGMHPGWAIAYGWSPLVLKEFANTGHLDSIAIFFLLLATYLALRFLFHDQRSQNTAVTSVVQVTFIGLCLACGVGAKLFPIVLAPILFMLIWRRQSLPAAAGFGVVTLAVSALLMSPLFMSPEEDSPELPPSPFVVQQEETSPSDGLLAFLSRWRMNDFVFMNIQENIELPSVYEGEAKPWFVIVPPDTRQSIIDSTHLRGNALLKWGQERMGREDIFQFSLDQTSFFVARLITLTILGCIVLWLAFRPTTSAKPEYFLAAAFLAIAWFWLTAPTQNPWYWCWAMPLVCFARNRWWIALSGFAFIYYLRFWFRYQLGDVYVLGGPYQGVAFFDFVVTWFEYAPFFVVLIVTTVVGWIKRQLDKVPVAT